MKRTLLDFLACPVCHGAFHLSAAVEEGTEVIEGSLRCTACGGSWQVVRGVPRFLAGTAQGVDARTAAVFGWEWQAFASIDEHHERQFLDWIEPVRGEAFVDRVVIEGGCGKGRHTMLVARYGARAVIGVDLSDAVDVAWANTRDLPNAHVVQADLRRLPVRPGSCDHAFSIGVLHHLPDPRSGFDSLARAVRGNGALSIWVYGAENNAWVSRFVSPLRTAVTSRLPHRALWVLSAIVSVPLFAALKLVYRPAGRSELSWLRRFLFYYPYLSYISGFPFREIHHIVHDHLAAPVAHYLRREEIESWYRDVRARDTVIAWHNRNSWRGYGIIPGGEAA